LDAVYIVHSALGLGLLESVYEACTAYEIQKQGLKTEVQVEITGCRLGFLINFNVKHLKDGIKHKVF